jgi:carboxylate-amine ligase
VNSHNRFEACRYGFRGELVEPYAGVKKRIGDDILETLDLVAPHARRLDCGEPLAALAAAVRADDSDASWLRARFAARGALADVVRDACSRWEKREIKGEKK